MPPGAKLMNLTLRTDKPDAEIGLYDEAGKQLDYYTWHADRNLAKELLSTIRDRLSSQDAGWADIKGIVVYQGPGSFTGLRIGLTVANTLAYGQQIPIIAEKGDDWINRGLARIQKGDNDTLALPHYGAEAHITMPKK
jgi:tRNA threonylcarbamoyladenosine biosynthesis protein TsaB